MVFLPETPPGSSGLREKPVEKVGIIDEGGAPTYFGLMAVSLVPSLGLNGELRGSI